MNQFNFVLTMTLLSHFHKFVLYPLPTCYCCFNWYFEFLMLRKKIGCLWELLLTLGFRAKRDLFKLSYIFEETKINPSEPSGASPRPTDPRPTFPIPPSTQRLLVSRNQCKTHTLSHMPLCISMISGVCVQGMWNAQVKGQVTETHRLKVNSHCDTALFISMYDITMVQP